MRAIILRLADWFVSLFFGVFRRSGTTAVPPSPSIPDLPPIKPIVTAPPVLAPLPTAPTPAIGPVPVKPPPTATIASELAAFIQEWNGKFARFHPQFQQAQCVELVNLWAQRLHIELFPFDAADFEFDSHPDCIWVPNTPTNQPLAGDMVVWGRSSTLPHGHTGIAHDSTVMTLDTFDQNWPFWSPAHLQRHVYGHYSGGKFVAEVRGWLHPIHARTATGARLQ